MEGFEVFIYIALGITAVFVISSGVLKKYVPEKKDKYLRVGFISLLLIGIATVIISLFIGGWIGIGYGFIGISILIGTILGGLINSATNHFLKSKDTPL